MSGEFKPGDVVVCVNDAPCRCCNTAWPVRVGSLHRVAAVGRGFNRPMRLWADALHLVGWPDMPRHPAFHGVNAARFRHLPKADEQFTAEMRAIRPVREEEPA